MLRGIISFSSWDFIINYLIFKANYEILKKVREIVFILLLLFFTVMMVIISIPYFGLDTKVAFLRIKQWVFRLYDGPISTIWITAFFIHVFTSIFSVIAGFTQFSRKFMWKKIHRSMGKIYLIVVLFFAAPSGLIMGLLANGGITSIIAFVLLSILWWYFTFMAYKTVRARDFERHAKYMYFSYALTLSAITLRLWKFCIVNYVYELPPMDLYRLVAWIGWVPNLVVAFWLVSKKKHLKLLTNEQ